MEASTTTTMDMDAAPPARSSAVTALERSQARGSVRAVDIGAECTKWRATMIEVMTTPEESRLHVDSDWKAQAHAEKERLAKQEEDRAAKQGPRGGPESLPPADFRSLVGVLASQAMSGLGMYGDDKGRVIVDPVGAKFAIDLIGVIEEKTKGNLTTEESAELESIVRELRMRFVQVMQMIARQGELESAPGAGAAGGPAAPLTGGAGSGAAAPSTRSPPPAGAGGPRIIVP